MTQTTTPVITPRDVLAAYLQTRAWAEHRDEMPFVIRPRIVADFLGIAEATIRKAGLRGRMMPDHPDWEIDIHDLLAWLAEEEIPYTITPVVNEFVGAVWAKAELLRRHTAERVDADAAVRRLQATIGRQAETARHEAETAKIQAGLTKELAARETHLAGSRRGREILRQRAEIKAAAEAQIEAERQEHEAVTAADAKAAAEYRRKRLHSSIVAGK
jgi:hypothetical protein